MRGPGFIHHHIHSQYSLLEGALKLGTLLDLAKADKQPALGVADTNNLFGALEFSEKAAGKGVQPLLGVELMPANEQGYANLSRLVSRAYLEGEAGRAAAQLGWLNAENIDGILCLT